MLLCSAGESNITQLLFIFTLFAYGASAGNCFKLERISVHNKSSFFSSDL